MGRCRRVWMIQYSESCYSHLNKRGSRRMRRLRSNIHGRWDMNRLKIFLSSCLLLSSAACLPAYAASELKVSQHIWLEFSNSEKAAILSKFPQVETIPSEAIGVIQSVQSVNRSTAGTSTGTVLGGALGQTLYIDNALRGSGSNYSATAQLGAALLGAAMGSTLDSAAQTRFFLTMV